MSHGQKTTDPHANNSAQIAVRAFIDENRIALLNASRLLGSDPAYGRSQTLLDNIQQGTGLTRCMRKGLVELHALLTLQNVGDPDRIETACFSAIHPADPVVEEICILADALCDLLVAIAPEETTPIAQIDIPYNPPYNDAA